jgi:AcrR family transcriptional regulator
VSGTSAKERLIEAAFALFAEQGYEQTTVDQIAERAGVSRMTFFRAFPSKEDVIFPDHARILATISDRLNAATPESSDVAVTEAARLVLVHYLDEGELARRRYALTRTVPALNDRETASIRQYQKLFRAYLGPIMADQPDGLLRAELLADAIVTAHNHVLRRWLRGVSDDPEAEFREAMGVVLRIFAASPAGVPDGGGRAAVIVVQSRRELDQTLERIRSLLD